MKIEAKVKEANTQADVTNQPKVVPPDEKGQCPEGTRFSAQHDGCIPVEPIPEAVSTMAKVPKDLAQTVVGTPAVSDTYTMKSGPEYGHKGATASTEASRKEAEADIIMPEDPMPKVDDSTAGPTQDTTVPKTTDMPEGDTSMHPTEPAKMTPKPPHDCGSDKHWDDVAGDCIPNEPITATELVAAEQARRIATAEHEALAAKAQSLNAQELAKFWEKQHQDLNVEHLKLIGKADELEQRIQKLENQRNEAQRNYLNEQTEKEKAVAKHRAEIANREEYREQAEQWKKTADDISKKYQQSLATNLELSKKNTQAHEDYLNIATEKEQLNEDLKKARVNAKKILRFRTK